LPNDRLPRTARHARHKQYGIRDTFSQVFALSSNNLSFVCCELKWFAQRRSRKRQAGSSSMGASIGASHHTASRGDLAAVLRGFMPLWRRVCVANAIEAVSFRIPAAPTWRGNHHTDDHSRLCTVKRGPLCSATSCRLIMRISLQIAGAYARRRLMVLRNIVNGRRCDSREQARSPLPPKQRGAGCSAAAAPLGKTLRVSSLRGPRFRAAGEQTSSTKPGRTPGYTCHL
jgi:hypothetical protein